jgi:glycosyltransferase involved in cell wall biosynthesis
VVNVLSVIHYPIFGGPGNRNSLVAQQLALNGFETHIVIPDEPGNAAERFAERGIGVTQIPLHRIRAAKNPGVHARYLAAMHSEVAALQWLIRERRIDVVVLNGSHNPHGAIAARREGVALVWQLLDTFGPPTFHRVMAPLVRRWSDVVMTNGMTTAAMHPGMMEFEGPLINFGPCVPMARFVPDPILAASARIELGLSETETVVGTVNNINPMKGHIDFVRAAALLRQRHEAKFVILGAEHNMQYTRALLEEAGRLGLRPGDQLIIRDPGSRVNELAQAFDLFWLTSRPRSEGMSTSLAEAQALGIPVVSTRSGAVHECMRDGETGYLVPPHDIAGIVRASMRLLTDRELRAEFSAAAMGHARRHFSVEATADRHAEAYEAAVEIRARRLRRTREVGL